MLNLFSSGTYYATSIGRGGWKTLFGPNASVQPNCNREGFNNNLNTGQRTRIGMITNEQNDCNSPDSRVGIGGQGTNCNTIDGLAVGSSGRCGSDRGDLDLYAFAWIYIR